MKLVEDYILLSRETRRSHLRLEDPCIIRGGDSFQMRGLLAHILNTTIPTNLTKKKRYLSATPAITAIAATPIIFIGELITKTEWTLYPTVDI